MYHTYIICSESTDRYYVGSTQDVSERLKRHNNSHSKSTKGKGPWKIIETFSFESRAEAIKLEKKVKRRGTRRYLEDIASLG